MLMLAGACCSTIDRLIKLPFIALMVGSTGITILGHKLYEWFAIPREDLPRYVQEDGFFCLARILHIICGSCSHAGERLAEHSAMDLLHSN